MPPHPLHCGTFILAPFVDQTPLPAPLKCQFGFCTSAQAQPLLQPRAQLLGVRGLPGWSHCLWPPLQLSGFSRPLVAWVTLVTLMIVLRTELPRSGAQRGQVVESHVRLQRAGIPAHVSPGPGDCPVAGAVATCIPACATHVNLPGAGERGIWG